jgi:hypothetical protein
MLILYITVSLIFISESIFNSKKYKGKVNL